MERIDSFLRNAMFRVLIKQTLVAAEAESTIDETAALGLLKFDRMLADLFRRFHVDES